MLERTYYWSLHLDRGGRRGVLRNDYRNVIWIELFNIILSRRKVADVCLSLTLLAMHTKKYGMSLK